MTPVETLSIVLWAFGFGLIVMRLIDRRDRLVDRRANQLAINLTASIIDRADALANDGEARGIVRLRLRGLDYRIVVERDQ